MGERAGVRAEGGRLLRVGVIGCGQIAATHVSTLAKRCGPVELHLCDVVPDAAARLAARTGVAAGLHDDPERMFGEQDLDVVLVLTPPPTHHPLVLRALAAGAHVLVEKPMALTPEEHEELFAAADAAARLLCVDHSMLLMPCVVEALERVAVGEVGRPLAFHCFYGHAEAGGAIPYGGPGHWAYRMPGGVLLNHLSHPASLLVAFLGAPEEVLALRSARNVMPGDVPDSLQVAVGTAAGYGSIGISMSHGNHLRQATVYGERGTVFLDLTRQTTVVSRHQGPIGLVPKMLGGVGVGLAQAGRTVEVGARVATGRLKREPGVRALVERYFAAVREGGPPPVSRENALGVARIQYEALLAPGLAAR